MKIDVLDAGYVERITVWGSDEIVIESARMSTDGGFKGWGGGYECSKCHKIWPANWKELRTISPGLHQDDCEGAIIPHEGDGKLLRYLWKNRHVTPFEMAGLTIEVKLPLFVVREWHRHRTQGYSEMSARYTPLPNENYQPTIERIVEGAAKAKGNRQAQGMVGLSVSDAKTWLDDLDTQYRLAQQLYEQGLKAGVPKELARLCLPVARYTKMRATANLRNWLHFLDLRLAPEAQWEIREYAKAVGTIVEQSFPRTWKLFEEEHR